MDRRSILLLVPRVAVIAAVVAGALAAGTQLRSARELSSGSQAAAAPSPSVVVVPTAVPTITPAGLVPPAAPIVTATPLPPKLGAATPSVPPTAVPMPVAAVSGRVTAGGKPVSRATVRAFPADDKARGPTPVPPATAQAVTDEVGRYSLRLPHGTYRVGASLETGFVPAPQTGFWWVTWYGEALAIGLGKDLVVRGDVNGADISMLRSVLVSGRVVGRDGVGVAAAQVRLFHEAPGPWRDRPFQWELGVARTDATGAFSARVVPLSAKVLASAAGTGQEVWTTVNVDLKGDTGGVLLALDRGHVVSGVLRDPNRRPLAETDYRAVKTDGTPACTDSCFGRTDASGRFAMTLPTGTFRLAAGPWDKPTYTSAEIAVSRDLAIDPAMATR